MRRISLVIGLLFALLAPLATPPANAQEVLPAQCLTQIYANMSHEHRTMRSVIFGQKKPSDLPVESVLYAREESGWRPWIKTDTDEWSTVETDESEDAFEPKDDEEMESAMELEDRRGLLEIRRAPTSELIPPITQAMRAFQCKLLSVCETVAMMQQEGASENFLVEVPGCLPVPADTTVLQSCKTTGGFSEVALGACEQVALALFERETQLVTLVMSYDAAYRSLMQFAGIFEGFLTDFRFSLLTPLWQTARTVSGLQNIPCFLSQCDQ